MMKYILVPTDFSENAENALIYAIELNKKFQAGIILFHAYVIPIMVTDVPVSITEDEEIRKEALLSLEELKKKYEKQYPQMQFSVELSGASFAGHQIITLSERKEADLIIMGTKGATGLKKTFTGSNAAEVIENSSCPVIAVPEGALFQGWKKIVIATNYALNDYENIGQVIEYGKLFDAEIILLHISTGEFEKAFEFNSIAHFQERMMEESNYEKLTFKLLEEKNALEGLENYLDEIKADIVVMTRRHRSFFKKLFSRSMTKRMAYHTEIPLWVFQEKTAE